MADLSITTANVVWTGNGKAPKDVTYGEPITNGQVVGLNTTDNEWYKLDANAALTGYEVSQIGIALCANGNGQAGRVAVDGTEINIGATTTAGTHYAVTSTDALTANGADGGIVAEGSLGSGDSPVGLFWGSGTAVVTLAISISPAAIP